MPRGSYFSIFLGFGEGNLGPRPLFSEILVEANNSSLSVNQQLNHTHAVCVSYARTNGSVMSGL